MARASFANRRFHSATRVLGACLIALAAAGAMAIAQAVPDAPASQAPPDAERPGDALGRDTPRGTVLGFLDAARGDDYVLASQYLNTPLAGEPAQDLARRLSVVLEARLPARLTEVSNEAEGSRANPLTPDVEVVGSIGGTEGTVEVVVERVERETGPIWLFAPATLDAIPGLYDEVVESQREGVLPRPLTQRRLGGVRLAEWLVLLLGIPAFYMGTVLLNRALNPLVARVLRRWEPAPGTSRRNALPVPARIILLALAVRWLVAALPFSLLVRQFSSSAATLVIIGAVVWLLILLNAEVERYLAGRLRPDMSAAVSLLRLLRRGIDALVVFGGLLALLRHLAIDPTPALAGLGVGGIAVALAAQKTLENVIAGVSLIVDQAVRVGDFLQVGTTLGTVEHIGLRSTRIRTLDRTVVSVPNSQIANMSLETFSLRDKFWFHPIIGLRYETTAGQLNAVVDGIRQFLTTHPQVERDTLAVRFLRLGAFSLDVEVFAYVFARDWPHFLTVQHQLLLRVMEIVTQAGTEIAFPSQRMYTATPPEPEPGWIQKAGDRDEPPDAQGGGGAQFER